MATKGAVEPVVADAVFPAVEPLAALLAVLVAAALLAVVFLAVSFLAVLAAALDLLSVAFLSAALVLDDLVSLVADLVVDLDSVVEEGAVVCAPAMGPSTS